MGCIPHVSPFPGALFGLLPTVKHGAPGAATNHILPGMGYITSSVSVPPPAEFGHCCVQKNFAPREAHNTNPRMLARLVAQAPWAASHTFSPSLGLSIGLLPTKTRGPRGYNQPQFARHGLHCNLGTPRAHKSTQEDMQTVGPCGLSGIVCIS